MGIYIPNMDKPIYCSGCPFKHGEWYDDYYSCAARCFEQLHVNLSTGIDDRCPIMSVQPHGRLVDADTVKSRMYIDPAFDDYCDYKWSEVAEAYKEIVDDVETIIPPST